MAEHHSFPESPRGCRDNTPSEWELQLATLFYGIALCTIFVTSAKGTRQSYWTWERHHRVTLYVIFVWGSLVSCTGAAILSALYLWNVVCASFYVYFFIVFLWCFEVQLVLQVIINRLALLMPTRAQARRIQWAVFGIILFINISIFITWIPTRMDGPPIFEQINHVWDRMQKVIFLIVDGGLNIYFVVLVRHHLIKAGFDKYKALYAESLVMIALSISLDICVIGLMSLPTPTVYLAFEPTQYLLKLYIEVNMADLIIKIVKTPNHQRIDWTGAYGAREGRTPRTGTGTKPCCSHCSRALQQESRRAYGNSTRVEGGVDEIDLDVRVERIDDGEIRKVVQTHVQTHQIDRDDSSTTPDDSSTTGVLRNDSEVRVEHSSPV